MSIPGRALGVALAGGLVLLAACATPPAALRADTLAYLQKMSSWAPTEAETARTLERILATEFVDQAEVLRQIADNTPRVRGSSPRRRRIEPRTSEVRQIHEIYVELLEDAARRRTATSRPASRAGTRRSWRKVATAWRAGGMRSYAWRASCVISATGPGLTRAT